MSGSRSASGGVTSVPVMGLYFMKSLKKTAKDYVQDGLVAMWDGIENAGWGVHDSNAARWTLLVGNYTFGTISGTWEWGDDCWRVPTLNGARMGGIVDLGRTRRTCEAVFSLGSEQVTTKAPILTCFGASNRMLVGRNYQGNFYMTFGGGNSILFSAFDAPVSMSIDFLDGSNNADRCSLNGTSQALYNVGSPATPGQKWLGYMGAGLAAWAQSVQAHYCCRIYDRILSADEVAHNSAIDKVRFNLP